MKLYSSGRETSIKVPYQKLVGGANWLPKRPSQKPKKK